MYYIGQKVNKRSDIKFSIVIPCYNRQDLVRSAIDSAIAQGRDDFEILVIDDGSEDSSWLSIRSYGSNVRAVSIKNGGVARARNIGIQMSAGTHIIFRSL